MNLSNRVCISRQGSLWKDQDLLFVTCHVISPTQVRPFTNVLHNQSTVGQTMGDTKKRVIGTSGREIFDIQGRTTIPVGTILRRGRSIRTIMDETMKGLSTTSNQIRLISRDNNRILPPSSLRHTTSAPGDLDVFVQPRR
jgi:hypothetical protein